MARQEKLWECGQALWGAGPRTEEWARARCDDLEEGRFAELLATLRPHVEECEAFRLGLGYFETNRERMRYDEFVRRFGGGRSGLQDGRGGTLQALRDAGRWTESTPS